MLLARSLHCHWGREVNQTMLLDAGHNTGQVLDLSGQNLANAGPAVMAGSGLFLFVGYKGLNIF